MILGEKKTIAGRVQEGTASPHTHPHTPAAAEGRRQGVCQQACLGTFLSAFRVDLRHALTVTVTVNKVDPPKRGLNLSYRPLDWCKLISAMRSAILDHRELHTGKVPPGGI